MRRQNDHAPRHLKDVARNQGPARDGAHSRLVTRLYVVVVLVLLVAPLACMPLYHADSSAEKRELAPAPQLLHNGSPNLNVLADAGAYFGDHFAFRNELVDLDASVKQDVFATSATPNVVVGTDGWLFYAGTMADYRRTSPMSEAELRNAAKNLSLLREYLQDNGKRFVLAIAPNKNSLYAEHMPYYCLQAKGDSDAMRLMRLLDEQGVTYVNLFDAFASDGEVLYYRRDSHWNERGALLAYGKIVEALGRSALAFEQSQQQESGHMGDLDKMLHPVTATDEAETHFVGTDDYVFANEAQSVEDAYIVTKGQAAGCAGNLIMYRDSFGNNLLPPFASAYQNAVFTKLVPYDCSQRMIGFADDVVVERAERHLGSLPRIHHMPLRRNGS